MIIKSHIRGGYRSAAEYLKEQGKNEKTRLVEISDPSAKSLDEAFHNMWIVASNTKATKPLHHISINPMKDERLTDKQVMAIVERCEEKYGYKMFHHQRVIVEHIKDGRQHFHVIWNRVSLMTGNTVWPGEHWKKSKQVCREMEVELGLKRPTPKRMRSQNYKGKRHHRDRKTKKQYNGKRRTSLKSGKRTHLKGFIKKSTTKTYLARGKLQSIRTTIKFNGGSGIQNKSGGHIISRPVKPINPVTIKPVYINSRKEEPHRPLMPHASPRSTKGWPEAAILDWATWGCRNPRRFFALWPELSM
jgi:hypothetical protein